MLLLFIVFQFIVGLFYGLLSAFLVDMGVIVLEGTMTDYIVMNYLQPVMAFGGIILYVSRKVEPDWDDIKGMIIKKKEIYIYLFMIFISVPLIKALISHTIQKQINMSNYTQKALSGMFDGQYLSISI